MKIYRLIIVLLSAFLITIAPADPVAAQNPQITPPAKPQPEAPTGAETIQTGAVLKVNGDAITSTAIIALLHSQTAEQDQKPDQQQFLRNTLPKVSDLVIKQVYNLLLYQHAIAHLEKLGISEEALDGILIQRRKEILSEITDYLKQGEKILKRSKNFLGEDDPVYDKFSTSMTALHNGHHSIESFIEKGEIIERF